MARKLDPFKTCTNLRSKEMYYGASDTTPEEEAEMEKAYGGCDTTAFWCRCTQGSRGPDEGIVGRAECTRPGRKCFVSIETLT